MGRVWESVWGEWGSVLGKDVGKDVWGKDVGRVMGKM